METEEKYHVTELLYLIKFNPDDVTYDLNDVVIQQETVRQGSQDQQYNLGPIKAKLTKVS